MRTRGSERASREANAVHWRTWGFELGGGMDKVEKTKSTETRRTINVGLPDSSVGPPSAAQKLVKDNYFGRLDIRW